MKEQEKYITKELYDLFENCCKHFNVSVDKCLAKSRKRELIAIRQMYCKIAKESTNYSLSVIGKEIKKDHATVLHACNQVDDLCKTNKIYNKIFIELKEHIYGKEILVPIDMDQIIKEAITNKSTV